MPRGNVRGDVKTCSACGGTFPLTAFYINTNDKGYRYPRSECKICFRAKRLAYKRSERVVEADRKRRESGYFREWYASTADERWAYSTAYRLANPDKARQRTANYRARKMAAFREPVERAIVFERGAGICGICGHLVDPDDFHVDHIIPLGRGGAHSYANTQLAHPLCNWRKNDRMPEVA